MLKGLLGQELFERVVDVVSPSALTEVRLRVGKPVVARNQSERFFLKRRVTMGDLEGVLSRATKHSRYAFSEEINRGYLPYLGGIRIGLAGVGVSDKGEMLSFSTITSLNIRVPHEVVGCAAPVLSYLEPFENTLVVAPPFAGKTTLIRDLARVLSSRYDTVIVDEREEIAPRDSGFQFGCLCDVVSGVPKQLVYEGILRSLSPEIVVLDELLPSRDLKTVEELAAAGVKFVASVHGDSLELLAKRHSDFVKHVGVGVLLGAKPKVGSIQSIVRFHKC